MEKKKDVYCSFCHIAIQGENPVYRGDKPYHRHHVKYHVVEVKVQHDAFAKPLVTLQRSQVN